jgi:hypothetical protein
LQNHTFIAINSAGLVDEDYLRNGEHIHFQKWIPLPDGTVSFVKQAAQRASLFKKNSTQVIIDFVLCAEKQDPVILLSHIPLTRAESARCGPLREKGTIHRAAGPGWQSTLSKQSTNFLLDTLRPSIIFSYVFASLHNLLFIFQYWTELTTVITATTRTPFRTRIRLGRLTMSAKSHLNPSPCLYTFVVRGSNYLPSLTLRNSLRPNMNQLHIMFSHR